MSAGILKSFPSVSRVFTKPGQTSETSMPLGLSYTKLVSAMAFKPALLALYDNASGRPR